MSVHRLAEGSLRQKEQLRSDTIGRPIGFSGPNLPRFWPSSGASPNLHVVAHRKG